jgi:hypothetical protein
VGLDRFCRARRCRIGAQLAGYGGDGAIWTCMMAMETILPAPTTFRASASSRASRAALFTVKGSPEVAISVAFTSRTKASWMKAILSRAWLAMMSEVAVSRLEI